ncbi:MAG: type III-A CRISPR-associated RAMP protein Csm4 [Thermodesulfovibrionales bacterium]
MEIYIYKLRFKGATHFGDTGIDLENVSEWINSDTLFAALMNAYCVLNGKEAVSATIETFKKNPPFLISSLFLYHGEEYFLPRPMVDDHISKDLKREMGKELKKLKWLNLEGFLRWLSSTDIGKIDIEKMDSAQKNYENAFTFEIRPRVSLDRVTQTSSLYHAGYVYFKKGAGLYGLVAFYDDNYIKQFEVMLKSLGETGLGGERTYGCGMFEIISFQKATGLFEEILNSNSDFYTLLSLYHPSEGEFNNIQDKLIAYDIIRKKGWITTGRHALPLKRKSVGFITEGSVLKEQPRGCLVDVTPDTPPSGLLDHRVYRYGYAFTAPLRRTE